MGHRLGGVGQGQAGQAPYGTAVKPCKALLLSEHKLFYRSDLAGYTLNRCQLDVGIAEWFGYQLAPHSHTE